MPLFFLDGALFNADLFSISPSIFKRQNVLLLQDRETPAGKFSDQTFHGVGRVKARAPWKFIDAPRGRNPRIRTTVLDTRSWFNLCKSR